MANYSEFFLQANVAPPVDLSAIEGICTLGGVSCGFAPGPTRILALGNEDLEVEEVKMWEIGYSGIINNRAFVTLDYYNSENDNFITDLLPQVGTSLGRINSNFGPYQPPSDLAAPLQQLLTATLQGALGPTYAILTNNLDGTPIFGAVSYTNFGTVDSQGIDLGLNYYIADAWSLVLNYSWFDFDIQGDVESYTTFDVNGNYRFNDRWSVGIAWANALDNQHWESFGGDLLGSRLLAHVAFDW